MDNNLELITNWFTSLGISPNQDKLKRQLSIIDSFFKYKGVGVLEAITGFGKTYVAIIAIYRLNLKFPEKETIVVVPTQKLYHDWKKHVEDFKLLNVTVYVVNSYATEYVKTKVKHKCDFLVIDEIHRVLSNKGKLFNQTISGTEYDLFFGMSATLDAEEKEILESLNIPIIDTVSMSEAKRFNYISDYTVYNLGITLEPELREIYDRYNDVYNSSNAKFQYFVDFDKNLSLIRACTVANEAIITIGNDTRTGKEWREWYADKMNWDPKDRDHPWSPNNIGKYAHQWNWALKNRKEFIYNSHAKIAVAREILLKFNVPTITFAETTNFVDALVRDLELFKIKAIAYHSAIKAMTEAIPHTKYFTAAKRARHFRQVSNGVGYYDEEGQRYAVDYFKPKKITGTKLRKRIIEDFENGKYQAICTAKALDEGFNVENIEMAIICSATSKVRNSIQRNGRALRFKPDKTARIVNLYLKDTQDERWLHKRQKGEGGIRWVTSIDEIQ